MHLRSDNMAVTITSLPKYVAIELARFARYEHPCLVQLLNLQDAGRSTVKNNDVIYKVNDLPVIGVETVALCLENAVAPDVLYRIEGNHVAALFDTLPETWRQALAAVPRRLFKKAVAGVNEVRVVPSMDVTLTSRQVAPNVYVQPSGTVLVVDKVTSCSYGFDYDSLMLVLDGEQMSSINGEVTSITDLHGRILNLIAGGRGRAFSVSQVTDTSRYGWNVCRTMYSLLTDEVMDALAEQQDKHCRGVLFVPFECDWTACQDVPPELYITWTEWCKGELRYRVRGSGGDDEDSWFMIRCAPHLTDTLIIAYL